MLPVHIYPMLESAIAAAAGHDSPTHRRTMGALLAPFSEVAATHPFAWFPERHSAEAIATPSADNRVVSEPYTKRMAAFLGSDQGAALILCSLGSARRAGVSDRAVFVWAGAEATDVYFPASPARARTIAGHRCGRLRHSSPRPPARPNPGRASTSTTSGSSTSIPASPRPSRRPPKPSASPPTTSAA